MPKRAPNSPHAATRKSKHLIAPALQPWLWCGVVSLVVLGGYFTSLSDKIRIPRPAGFAEYNDARFQKYLQIAKSNPERRKVVLIGSSRTKYATEYGEDDPKTIGPSPLDRFNTFRLVKNVAVFENFRPFVGKILKSRPDVIVIEIEQLALKRRPRSTRHENIIEYLKFVLFGVGRWKVDLKRERNQQFAKPCSAEDEAAAYRGPENKIIDRVDRDKIMTLQGLEADDTLAIWFAKAAALNNIPVLWLTFPEREQTISLYGNARTRAAGIAAKQFQHLPTVSLMKYPQPLSKDYYCDSGHLNSKGRAVFTNWLANLVQKKL